ncbi:MAG TPA: Fic family protein [Tepidisphaeraceae bacterium]|nr:Fic family protein [Tepidisphaeraceae bacterium]
MSPLFLTLEQILRTHSSLIERYGGGPGVRDAGLLQSAVAMPQASFGGEFPHKNLFEMAAAYLFHIHSLTATSALAPRPASSFWP